MAEVSDVYGVNWTKKSLANVVPGDYIRGTTISGTLFEGKLTHKPYLLTDARLDPEQIGAWNIHVDTPGNAPLITAAVRLDVEVGEIYRSTL